MIRTYPERNRLELNKWILIILLCILGYIGMNEDFHIFTLVTETKVSPTQKQDTSSPNTPSPGNSNKYSMVCQSDVYSVSESDIYNSKVPYSVLTVPPVKSVSFDNHSTTSLLSMSEKYRIQIIDYTHDMTSIEFHRIHQGAVRFCNMKHSRTLVAVNERPPLTVMAIPSILIYIMNESPMHSKDEYTIDISPTAIEMSALSYEGVLHGLQTLQQLLHAPLPIQVPIQITDYPEQPWRGIRVVTVITYWCVCLYIYVCRCMCVICYTTMCMVCYVGGGRGG